MERPTPAEDGRLPPDTTFAEILLDEGREELNRADGKASILLASSGVIFSVLISAGMQGEWTPRKLGDHPVTEWAFWLGLAFGCVGIVLLAWSLLPRIKHVGDRGQLAYFGHVVLFREKRYILRKSMRAAHSARAKQELKRAITDASTSSFDRTVDQVWNVSNIVHKKYWRIRYSLLSYAMSAALCLGAVITNQLL